jgi:hypothetical protein
MAAIIAFMISLGVIMSADEATPELIDQYEEVWGGDIDTM